MQRRAFTAVEVLMTLGIVAVTAGLAVPVWRGAQIRKDLELATQQVKLALTVAQSSAREGINGSGWGVYVDPAVGGAVTYAGLSYDGTWEDQFGFPPTIAVTGQTDIAFLPVSGAPTVQGEMIFTSLTNDQVILTITAQGAIALTGTAEGADGGGIGGIGAMGGSVSSNDASAGNSSASSVTSTATTSSNESTAATTSATQSMGATSSVGSAGSAGSQDADDEDADDQDGDDDEDADENDDTDDTGGNTSGLQCMSGSVPVACDDPLCTSGPCDNPAECDERFVVSGDDTLFTTGLMNVEVRALGAEITYGAGGPEVDVRVSASTDNGKTWTALFNDKDIDGGETASLYNVAKASKVVLKLSAKYQSFFSKTRTSNDNTGFVRVLRNGDSVPSITAFGNQNAIASFLRTYVQNGKVAIGEFDAIVLAELGTDSKNSSAFDLQDAVLLIRVTPVDSDVCSGTSSANVGSSSASTGTASGPRFKIVFDRVQNFTNGNAAKAVFVGPDAKQYADGAWIPLTASNGQVIQDGALTEDVKGLAVERRNGIVRVLSHGSHTGTSREVVDATVVFDGAWIVGVENDTSGNATENPFDKAVSDTSDGDEITLATDRASVLFQTRVTVSDDAMLVQWKAGAKPADTTAEEQKKITICHVTSGKGTSNIAFETIKVSQNAWAAHEDHGDVRGACSDQKEIMICHFTGNPSSPYKNLAIFDAQWSAYKEVGDRLGACTDDDDGDRIKNWQDVCPVTGRKESPTRYLLWFRNVHGNESTQIFQSGPTRVTSEYTLEDTDGCDCQDILNIAEGKPGAVAYKTPELYLSLRSLPSYYVDTARKFGCTDSLVENVRQKSNR